LSEEVVGVVPVIRSAFMRIITETLYFTAERTVVAKTSGGKSSMLLGAVGGVLQYQEAKKKGEQYSQLSLEDILKADKSNYAIPTSEVTEVELKKYGKVAKINFKTTTQHGKTLYGETKWQTLEPWKDTGEKLENMLRSIFKDRLIVKK
jgi:hypothetical protein